VCSCKNLGGQKFRDGTMPDGTKQKMHLPDGSPKGIK